MPQTPNHRYNIPSEGAQDWHEPLNENFRQYDTDIEIRDEDLNKRNYEPKQGAKFLATDTGNVFVGDGSNWIPVPGTGQNPELRWVDVENRGTFGEVTTDSLSIGRSDTPPSDPVPIWVKGESGDNAAIVAETPSGDSGATAVYAEASSSSGNISGIYSECQSSDGSGVLGVNRADSGSTVGVEGRASSPDGVGVLAINFNGLALRTEGDSELRGDAVVYGSFEATGTKNFVQSVDTDDGEKEVVYTATEAPTPRTGASGVAELEDGRAVVDLPEHFGWVTDDDEPVVVETTPYSADSAGLAVVERSPDRLVVEDLDGDGDYEFAYTVRGTREGYADKEVVREPSTEPSGQDQTASPADD
jgi:hypothetical protein